MKVRAKSEQKSEYIQNLEINIAKILLKGHEHKQVTKNWIHFFDKYSKLLKHLVEVELPFEL